MGTSDGAVHGTVTVLDHGPAENSWCLLIAGDGFTSAQLGSFKTAVDVHVAFLQAHLTGALNWQKINVIRRRYPNDIRFATLDTDAEEKACVGVVRFFGSVSSKYYLLWSPAIFTVVWIVALVLTRNVVVVPKSP